LTDFGLYLQASGDTCRNNIDDLVKLSSISRDDVNDIAVAD